MRAATATRACTRTSFLRARTPTHQRSQLSYWLRPISTALRRLKRCSLRYIGFGPSTPSEALFSWNVARLPDLVILPIFHIQLQPRQHVAELPLASFAVHLAGGRIAQIMKVALAMGAKDLLLRVET